jgi:hypothetical protein
LLLVRRLLFLVRHDGSFYCVFWNIVHSVGYPALAEGGLLISTSLKVMIL